MAKDGEKSDWKEFLWNPRTREFLGRTASSWGLIFLFYLIFYTCLAGMFALTMYVMLQTLDEHTPTWQDRLSTPGLVIRPRADDTFEIVYTIEDTESWDLYAQALDKFLQRKFGSCPFLYKYFIQEDSGEVKNNPKRSCQFNRTVLQNCSGIDDRYYGYREGQPCIIIKLNRKDDADKIGELIYFPPNGTINPMYFPYYGKKAQVNYSQPLVAVKFLNITHNEDVNIECKINAENIPVGGERDKFAGRVSFKLRINSKN
ncbi:cyclin-dependent kinase inhibitor 3 [Sarotherodon galilaeus]